MVQGPSLPHRTSHSKVPQPVMRHCLGALPSAWHPDMRARLAWFFFFSANGSKQRQAGGDCAWAAALLLHIP